MIAYALFVTGAAESVYFRSCWDGEIYRIGGCEGCVVASRPCSYVFSFESVLEVVVEVVAWVEVAAWYPVKAARRSTEIWLLSVVGWEKPWSAAADWVSCIELLHSWICLCYWVYVNSFFYDEIYCCYGSCMSMMNLEFFVKANDLHSNNGSDRPVGIVKLCYGVGKALILHHWAGGLDPCPLVEPDFDNDNYHLAFQTGYFILGRY